MRDTKHLPLLSYLLHLLPNRIGRLTAHVRVHFVKHQHGNLVLGGEDGLQGQHHAREFARRGDGSQGARWFPGVWRELKLNRIHPLKSHAWQAGPDTRHRQLDTVHANVETALLEAEVGELLADGLAEFRDDLAPLGRKRLAGAPEFGLELLEFGI